MDVLADSQEQRTAYVEQMGWIDLDGEPDVDAYDSSRFDTTYLVESRRIDTRERAFVSMRLTAVRDSDNVLSIHMWDEARARDQSIEGQFARNQFLRDVLADIGRHQLPVFDVTRLVALVKVEQPERHLMREYAMHTQQGIVRLVGAAAGVAGMDGLLLFTSTPDFLRVMHRSHLPLNIIVEGRISQHDAAPSYLCWAHMRTAWQTVAAENPEGAKLFSEGYRSVTGVAP
jgi:hypothetical protein